VPAASPTIGSPSQAAGAARPGYNLDALHQLWAEDPDAAKQIMAYLQDQDEASRKALGAKYSAAAPVYLELMRLPPEERPAALQSAASYLTQAGLTPEEIAAIKLDDRSLHLYGAIGAGIEHYRTVMGPEKYGEGQTAVDPFTNHPLFRTPKQGSSRVGYDEQGREFTYTTPGDPGFGLGDVPGFTAPTLTTGGGSQAAPGGGGQPRGTRNNNPGNLRASDWTKGQPGYKGVDSAGYAVFDSEESGRRAGETLLHNYLTRGFDTPAKIVGRWAPAGENTPAQVANYTAHIAERLGIGPNDPVTGDMVPRLFDAQREFENGTFRGPGRAAASGPSYTGGTRPGGKKKPSETRVLGGKTYYKIDGRWYDNVEGT
jgi:hypothetical protein